MKLEKIFQKLVEEYLQSVNESNRIIPAVGIFRQNPDGKIETIFHPVVSLENEKQIRELRRFMNKNAQKREVAGIFLCLQYYVWARKRDDTIAEEIDFNETKPMRLLIFVLQTPSKTYIQGYSFLESGGHVVINPLPIISDVVESNSFKGKLKVNFDKDRD